MHFQAQGEAEDRMSDGKAQAGKQIFNIGQASEDGLIIPPGRWKGNLNRRIRRYPYRPG